MKTSLHYFCLFFLLCNPLFSQHYRVINSGVTKFFSHDGNVKTLHVDSVSAYPDTVYYLSPQIRKVDFECYTPYGASWAGSKIKIFNNGLTQFYNRNGDTLVVNANASLNEEWIMARFEDFSTIKAKVISVDTMTFLGLTDSVKTITFSKYNGEMPIVDNALAALKIQLSKNYGIITSPNFHLFPAVESDGNHLFESNTDTYHVIGITSPKAGLQNLRWFDVYDFQVGDELGIEDWSHAMENGRTYKFMYTFLKRTDFVDSIIYSVKRLMGLESWTGTEKTYAVVNDTITMKISSDTLFDYLPEVPVIVENSAVVNSMQAGQIISKSQATSFSGDLSCLREIFTTGMPILSYYKGLGGPYWEKMGMSASSDNSRTLEWYKKGSVTWGTPLVINAIQEQFRPELFKVFPSPAADFISVEHNIKSGLSHIDLLDIHGRVVLSIKPQYAEIIIDVSMLPSGVYFCCLLSANGIIARQPFVK